MKAVRKEGEGIGRDYGVPTSKGRGGRKRTGEGTVRGMGGERGEEKGQRKRELAPRSKGFRGIDAPGVSLLVEQTA